MEKNYLSKEKFSALQDELKHLQTEKRKEVAVQLEHARSLGDLSENAEYHDARDQQAQVEDRINYLQDLLKNVEIVKKSKSDSVEVGTTMVVQKKGDKEKKELSVVGSEESDMLAGKISHTSPLGQAALGTSKGDTFTFKTPKGEVEYKVLEIK